MSLLKRRLMTGLLVVIPTWATWLILKTLYTSLENVLGPMIEQSLPGRYVPGLGFVALILLLILAGMLASYAIGRRLLALWDYLLTHVPVVRNVYLTLKAVVDALSLQQRENLERVVMLEYPRKGIYALGFVTGSAQGQIRAATDQETLSVFLPTTPNPTSGFLLFVPADDVIPMPMSIEEGMKCIISGGMYMPPVPKHPGNGKTPAK
ncbi:MAG: DUF502 domain-containing protein [Armatimonadetes bacterium]|nr:DUF502 domain-containing protein [Armatimonadota bacterium]